MNSNNTINIPKKFKINNNVFTLQVNPLKYEWYFKIIIINNISYVYCCDINENIYNHNILGKDIRILREHFPIAKVEKDGKILIFKTENTDITIVLWQLSGIHYHEYLPYIIKGTEIIEELHEFNNALNDALNDATYTKEDIVKLFHEIYGERLEHYEKFLKENYTVDVN